MMRHALSMLGGIALAVGLFWMLALLVAPPEQQVDEPIMTMSMTMVEAPEVAPEQEAPPPAPAQAAPAPPPMPTPAPAPVATSTIALPEVELPDAPVEPVELESELPELTEAQPKPTPRPQPAPEPAPEPSPEPAETAAPSPEPAAAQRDAAPAAEPAPSNEPVSVGQVAPTNRVNPSYPPRAQRRGMEGFVEVEFVIQRNGSVDGSSIRVTNAQPRRVFEDAAREAIARWQFEPSQQLRRATQRIEFQLR
ncbi:MAG TPA: energy transducer TonB [Halomonas sp.]|jgi:protein TonB|uniref:energy transducer TonB n=1 Tax=Halomonadaceae TaxID=28256 RepID=UPI0007832154|nr:MULTISPECIES: energy transducer TonB [unclassified Halomonas]MEE3267683.1 TonB family protein [Pseudomonadota bacterium]PHR04823.1 MAG: iron transporter [Halomonas sp.]HAY16494.1 energy transducer TonB [Halomonas sp.]HBN59457.1 energy transducer TonB [Halomonas sp.]HBQ06328.1 energy transducer TonB [Halomonas sp.]|tara:strand:- start:5398 stop:6150 length:753 start_codon:yes stop_codon:yes gene_type:complete